VALVAGWMVVPPEHRRCSISVCTTIGRVWGTGASRNAPTGHWLSSRWV